MEAKFHFAIGFISKSQMKVRGLVGQNDLVKEQIKETNGGENVKQDDRGKNACFILFHI